MKRLLLFLGMVLFTVVSYSQRTITGVVSDDTGEGLIGASILLEGSDVGTVTDFDGSYSIEVPEAGGTLLFSYIGYADQSIPLGASNQVDVVLQEGVALEEVVVTGLGIKRDKKALGYAVTSISNKDIQLKPETDIARLFRGKAPGVDITSTSGLAGSGTNIIIRGYSSISGSNQPLFVIDGVPFNTDTNSDSDFARGGATASSRFLDLDPNNISEVSILKGLSATVLYGEAGKNGVILVTTKNAEKVEGNKKMEISLNQSLSFTDIANLPDYQDVYGNGFFNGHAFFFSNWGAAFDNECEQTINGTTTRCGVNEDGTITHPLDQARYAAGLPEFQDASYPYQAHASAEDFWETGLVSNTSIGLQKGFGKGGISANYSYLSDEGFTPGNVYTKHNFGLGANAQLDNGLKISSTFNFASSEKLSPPAAPGQGSNPSGNGTDGSSLFSNLLYTPRSIDLIGLPFENPLTGEQVYYRRGSAIQNPLWTVANTVDRDRTNRFFGNFNLSYEVNKNISLQYRFGLDTYSQNNFYGVNKGGSQIPNGILITSNRTNTITDQVANVVYNFDLSTDWKLDGVAGLNLRREVQDRDYLRSTDQLVFGLLTHENFINSSTDFFNTAGNQTLNARTEENTIGAYFTATASFRNYLYIAFQGRNDWTSTLESNNNSIFYPSTSVSFIPTEAIPALQNNKTLTYLKLRLGYGTSAGYPNPYSTRSILGQGTRAYVDGAGDVYNTNFISNTIGNPDLKPELHSELEFGIEGRFLENRVSLDFSYYNKLSKDLIIALDLDPSTGYRDATINAAEIKNEGVEISMNVTPIRKKNLQWDLNFNFTANENTVNKVADGIDRVIIAGFSDLGNFAVPGSPYGAIYGTGIQRNANGDPLVNEAGIYVPNPSIGDIGDPNPDFNFNYGTTLTYKDLSFGMNWNFVKGGDIYSITADVLSARGILENTNLNRDIPVILPGVLQEDGVTPNNIQIASTEWGFRTHATGGATGDELGVYDGTHIRLREVSLNYKFPKKLLEKTPFGSLVIGASGQNLWFKAFNFPSAVNFDPEVLSLGVGNGRGFDFLTGPTAKKYGVNLSVTF